ncbi:MAG: hypothetical protein QM627_13555 [Luteolibacter sp.]
MLTITTRIRNLQPFAFFRSRDGNQNAGTKREFCEGRNKTTDFTDCTDCTDFQKLALTIFPEKICEIRMIRGQKFFGIKLPRGYQK